VRAEECRRLAGLTASPEARAGYEALAEQYEEIAKMELKLADIEKPQPADLLNIAISSHAVPSPELTSRASD
jgi:hypothetical protein